MHSGAPEEEREHSIAVAAAGGCRRRRYAPRPINFHNELAKGGWRKEGPVLPAPHHFRSLPALVRLYVVGM